MLPRQGGQSDAAHQVWPVEVTVGSQTAHPVFTWLFVESHPEDRWGMTLSHDSSGTCLSKLISNYTLLCFLHSVTIDRFWFLDVPICHRNFAETVVTLWGLFD